MWKKPAQSLIQKSFNLSSSNLLQSRADVQFNLGFDIVHEKKDGFAMTFEQVHGADGAKVEHREENLERKADWIWTQTPQLRVGVFVADCTASLLGGVRKGSPFVAALHCGWRGTAKEIIQKAIKEISPDPGWMAWMSPSICQEHFEVGDEVLDALQLSPAQRLEWSRPSRPTKSLLDLRAYQRALVHERGGLIHGSSLCTYCQPEFISYRQSGPNLQARHLAWVEML